MKTVIIRRSYKNTFKEENSGTRHTRIHDRFFDSRKTSGAAAYSLRQSLTSFYCTLTYLKSANPGFCRLLTIIIFFYGIFTLSSSEKNSPNTHHTFSGIFGQGNYIAFNDEKIISGFVNFKADFNYSLNRRLNKYSSIGLTLSLGNNLHINSMYIPYALILINSINQKVLFNLKTGDELMEKFWLFENGVTVSFVKPFIIGGGNFENGNSNNNSFFTYAVGPSIFIGRERVKDIVVFSRIKNTPARERLSFVFGTFFDFLFSNSSFIREGTIAYMFSAGVEFRAGVVKRRSL